MKSENSTTPATPASPPADRAGEDTEYRARCILSDAMIANGQDARRAAWLRERDWDRDHVDFSVYDHTVELAAIRSALAALPSAPPAAVGRQKVDGLTLMQWSNRLWAFESNLEGDVREAFRDKLGAFQDRLDRTLASQAGAGEIRRVTAEMRRMMPNACGDWADKIDAALAPSGGEAGK